MEYVWYLKVASANEDDKFYFFSSKKKVMQVVTKLRKKLLKKYSRVGGYEITMTVGENHGYLKMFGDIAKGYDYGYWEWGKQKVL